MSAQLPAIVKNGKIELLEAIDLPEGTQLIVILNDLEQQEWNNLTLAGLNRSYTEDEPEYKLSQVKELNPADEGG